MGAAEETESRQHRPQLEQDHRPCCRQAAGPSGLDILATGTHGALLAGCRRVSAGVVPLHRILLICSSATRVTVRPTDRIHNGPRSVNAAINRSITSGTKRFWA